MEAVQWTGSNIAQVRELTGDNIAYVNDDLTLTVTAKGRENRIVLRGWWVSRASDGHITTHSTDAFSRLFEPAN